MVRSWRRGRSGQAEASRVAAHLCGLRVLFRQVKQLSSLFKAVPEALEERGCGDTAIPAGRGWVSRCYQLLHQIPGEWRLGWAWRLSHYSDPRNCRVLVRAKRCPRVGHQLHGFTRIRSPRWSQDTTLGPLKLSYTVSASLAGVQQSI